MSEVQVQGAIQAEAKPEAAQGTGNDSGGAEKVERLSPQFAALARKEKALRLEAQKIKQEREAFSKERDQFKSPGYVTKEDLMKNPIGILTSHGWTPNQIAEMLLSDTQAPNERDQTISELRKEIDELKGKTSKFETQFTERDTQEREQAIKQIRNEVKLLVDSDENYETIKASNKAEAVVEHIQQTYDEDGILLSVEEAAKEVEELLVEEATKLAGLNKIRQRLQPKTDTPQVATNQRTQQSQPIKTLTHDMVSSTATQQISAKDRVKRAIMRAQGLDPDTGKPIAG